MPGLTVIRLLRIRIENFFDGLFYTLALSLALVPLFGLFLSNTTGIYSATVIGALVLIDSYGMISVIREFKIVPRFRQNGFRPFFDKLSRLKTLASQPLALLAVAGLAITLYNWKDAIGVSSIDLGVHVYWAKVIIQTGHLPNYYIVEPLDQAVKFTYGAHTLLAVFFLTNGASIETLSWIPAVVGALGLWLGVALFTWRLTNSTVSGILAATLMGMAYHPGGYIQRGNLPDIIGYFLVLATLYSVLLVSRNQGSYRYAFGLTSVAVIPFHQLATVILPFVLLSGLGLMIVFSRKEVFGTLRTLFSGWRNLGFWSIVVLLGLLYAATSTYVSHNSVTELATSGWQPWVQPFDYYPNIIGPYIFYLGLFGVFMWVIHRTLGYNLLLGWILAMVLLANALQIGLPIPDPQRFVWRSTEPLCIFAGVLISEMTKRVPKLYASLTQQKIRFLASARGGMLLGLLIVPIAFVTLQVTATVLIQPPRYYYAQPYLNDDIRMARWLVANGTSPTAVTVNDVDIDNSATWIQPYSMYQHIIYKVAYANVAAPEAYVQIYRDMASLYNDPVNATAYQIITRYNVQYVVAHSQEIPVFESSTHFKLGFQTGESAIFEPTGV